MTNDEHAYDIRSIPFLPPCSQPKFVEADATLNRCRILVVDDNRDSADTLATLLQSMGNFVRTAYDGLEAVELAGSFGPEVVLLDIGLPRIDSHEACRRIRQQLWGTDMTIIALTGWGQDEDRRKSVDAGFDAHLIKPADIDILVKLLAEIAAGLSVTQAKQDGFAVDSNRRPATRS